MSRVRLSVLVLALGTMALAASACTTPSTPVPGAWPTAGCIDGAGTNGSTAPDLKFNGVPNQRGNATISAVILGGSFSISGDGTCSGQPVGAITIVRAADLTAANTACATLNAGTATPFAGSAWTLPADGYSCSETITL